MAQGEDGQMTHRDTLIRDIGLHREAVAKHLANKKFHAAEAAQSRLDAKVTELRAIDTEAAR